MTVAVEANKQEHGARNMSKHMTLSTSSLDSTMLIEDSSASMLSLGSISEQTLMAASTGVFAGKLRVW